MKQAILLLGVSLVVSVFFCGCGNEAEKTEGNGIETVEINKNWTIHELSSMTKTHEEDVKRSLEELKKKGYL